MVAKIADVRERHELREAVEAGLADLGKIDIVLANAGILPMAMGRAFDAMSFVDASDVDLLGVMNTVAVAIPHLANGSSVIITGSTAGMIRGTTDNPNMGPGGRGYGWSKRVLIEYVEEMSMALADRMIRVNAIHPTNCNTHLLQNDGMYSMFRPDLTQQGKQATREDAEPLFTLFQAMPIPYVEPEDIANLGVFLASEESRYITGQQIRVDGGFTPEVAQRTWGIVRSVVSMQEAVQDRLHEFVDNRLPGGRLGSEEGRPQRNHADDHRHRRVRRQIRVARLHPADAHALGADLAENGERSADVGDACTFDLLLA